MSVVRWINTSGIWKRRGWPDIDPGGSGIIPPDATMPTLAWHDEFDGSVVDTTKWNVRNGWIGGNESSICWAANVTVSGSNLVIQPRRQTTTSGSTTRQYTSGYLDTTGGYGGGGVTFAANRPCLFEMRASLPMHVGTSGGMWPAFWIRDCKQPTPSLLGEIDVMEAWEQSDSATTSAQNDSSKPERRYLASSWANTNSAVVGPTTGNRGWATAATEDLTAYHNYGVKIATDGSLTYTYDSVTSLRSDAASTYTYLPTAFLDYGIRLNLQVGQPAYWGDPDASTDFTQNMKVDWVRVWTP